MGELVRLEKADGIGTIRLDRPPMNALNSQVQNEIRDAADEAANDPSIRAVVVYGAVNLGGDGEYDVSDLGNE